MRLPLPRFLAPKEVFDLMLPVLALRGSKPSSLSLQTWEGLVPKKHAQQSNVVNYASPIAFKIKPKTEDSVCVPFQSTSPAITGECLVCLPADVSFCSARTTITGDQLLQRVKTSGNRIITEMMNYIPRGSGPQRRRHRALVFQVGRGWSANLAVQLCGRA